MRISDWSSDVCSSDLRDASARCGSSATGGKADRRPYPARRVFGRHLPASDPPWAGGHIAARTAVGLALQLYTELGIRQFPAWAGAGFLEPGVMVSPA